MTHVKPFIALVAAAALVLGSVAPASADEEDARPKGYSTHIPHLTAGQGAYVDLAMNSGANTIRDEAWWGRIEASPGVYDWTLPDQIVQLASQRGLHVLLIADTSPQWASGETEANPFWFSAPPLDPADYGAFAGKLADRYGVGGAFWTENPTLTFTPLAGIEIWNEQNCDVCWGGFPADPAKYTDMLQAAYTAIKAEDATIPVVVGGLASIGAYDAEISCPATGAGINPVAFLEQMYAQGAAGHFDAVGIHPYVFDFTLTKTMPQLLEYSDCSTWSQMAETPVSLRSLMIANGDSAKEVWITEAGIPTCTFFAAYPCVDGIKQSELMLLEYSLWKTYDWSGSFIMYDLRDDCYSPVNVECNFGAITAFWDAPKQLYNDMKAVWLAE